MAYEGLPVVDVQIEDGIIIPCPAVGFKNRWAAKCCESCEYFKGISQKGVDGEWQQNYAVLCDHPIERNCHVQLKVVEED